MPSSLSRRNLLLTGTLFAFGIVSSGCGTIMHPERKGQPAGDLDWSIVLLDGVGLLLFFIPGIIAFAVDFNNGTIYLPADEKGQAGKKRTPSGRATRKVVSCKTPSGKLTFGAVEHVLSEQMGKKVRLIQGQYETHPLNSPEELWEHQDLIASNPAQEISNSNPFGEKI